MRRLCKTALCIFSFACVSATSQAAIILGPVKDFAGTFFLSATITVDTGGGITCAPPPSNLCFSHSDQNTITITFGPIDIYVDTYIQFNPTSAFIDLVDIWAVDQTLPPGLGVSLTGFDISNPQMIPAGPENFIGLSGTFYPAPLNATLLVELPFLLGPGFDLTQFQGGDPTSIVYVARATVPRSDFAVPEPATLALLGVGLAGIGFLRRRKVR